MEAGDCVLHLEIMQAAGGKNEPLVSKSPRQFHACRVNIAESQPKSPASGPQAFAGTASVLRHDSSLSACNVSAEMKTLGQRYESNRVEPVPGNLTKHSNVGNNNEQFWAVALKPLSYSS
jgi:hypothetical protein